MINDLLCSFPWGNTWVFLTAVGTIAMAWTTYKALRKNDDQVAEMKRQWEEDHRPYLDVNLIDANANYTTDSRLLCIENFGKGVANNIQLKFDNSFIDNIPIEAQTNYLKILQKKSFKLLPNRNLTIPFCCILDYHPNNYRIDKRIFDFNLKNGLIEYLNHPISVKIQYKWNGQEFEEGPFLLSYNKA